MRVRRYTISMAIRTACFLLGVLIQGWVGLVLMGGAVLLPYVAVVLANQVARPRQGGVPPMVVKDTSQLPPSHPDRTEPAY